VWFFSNIKLVLGSIASVALSIFYFIFKARGKEIEEQKREIESLEQNKKFNEVLDKVNEDIKQGFTEEEREIEEQYDDKKEIVYKATDKPLTPTLLSKLRDSQGLSDRNNESSE